MLESKCASTSHVHVSPMILLAVRN